MGTKEKAYDESAQTIQRRGKAQKVIESLGVKLHRFYPSGRVVLTVVGREGDCLVDYDDRTKKPIYCSCDDFHFRVLSGTVLECYHMIAVRNAIESGLYAVIEFRDEEYSDFVKALVSDLFANINQS